MRLTPLLGALAALVLPGAALAAGPIALGVNAGTPGLGPSIQLQASPSFVVRGDLDWLNYSHDEDYSDVSYDGRLKNRTAGLFADWHPGGGAFLVSGGAYFGSRKVDFTATPSTNVEIGGQVFTPTQVGQLNGKAKMSTVQPFAGLGYDNTFVGDNGWGFRALAGVAFSKKPDIDLAATGPLANDANFQARLRQEEADIRDDAKKIRYFPVLQVGLTKRF